MQLSEEKSIELLMREWEVEIQSQMHFNELIMKFRTAGLTIVGLFLSATAGALRFDQTLALAIWVSAIILLIAFWRLDVYYYYKLLIGAVKKTQKIDQIFSEQEMSININNKQINLFGLTKSITDEIDTEAISKNYNKSKKLIHSYYGMMGVAAIIILGIVLNYRSINEKHSSSSDSQRAINLVRSHLLQYLGITTIEKDIQSTLSNFEGDINFLGWQAKKINSDVYIVSNLYVRSNDTLGWLFEVNLPNTIMRSINYLKEDSLLLRKYGYKIDKEFLTDYEFSKLKDAFEALKSSFSDRDLNLLIKTTRHRREQNLQLNADEFLLEAVVETEKGLRAADKEFDSLIPPSKKEKR